jgi:phage gp46-like protein
MSATIDVILDGGPSLAWFCDPLDDSGDGELADAVVVALGTDRLADPSDVLPDPDSDDRRGWWGDFEAQFIHDGWAIGTRLWLLTRAKIVGAGARGGATTARAETYIREALQPFVDRKVASRIAVKAERVGIDRIDAQATLFRGPSAVVDLRYAILWSGIAGVVKEAAPSAPAPGMIDFSDPANSGLLPGLTA